jgi:hypothetical protein
MLLCHEQGTLLHSEVGANMEKHGTNVDAHIHAYTGRMFRQRRKHFFAGLMRRADPSQIVVLWIPNYCGALFMNLNVCYHCTQLSSKCPGHVQIDKKKLSAYYFLSRCLPFSELSFTP